MALLFKIKFFGFFFLLQINSKAREDKDSSSGWTLPGYSWTLGFLICTFGLKLIISGD